jgi:hypothetical protein
MVATCMPNTLTSRLRCSYLSSLFVMRIVCYSLGLWSMTTLLKIDNKIATFLKLCLTLCEVCGQTIHFILDWWVFWVYGPNKSRCSFEVYLHLHQFKFELLKSLKNPKFMCLHEMNQKKDKLKGELGILRGIVEILFMGVHRLGTSRLKG